MTQIHRLKKMTRIARIARIKTTYGSLRIRVNLCNSCQNNVFRVKIIVLIFNKLQLVI